MPGPEAASRRPQASAGVDRGRRLALALLLYVLLLPSWAPLAERLLAGWAPEALLQSDLFTPEQLDFIAKVWNSEKLYVIYDKYGRAWVVGQGRLPEPLAQSLSTVANAATNKLWRIYWGDGNDNGLYVEGYVSGWPEQPVSNPGYRTYRYIGLASDPNPDDGNIFEVRPWSWPAYAFHVWSFPNPDLVQLEASILIDYGRILAWSDGVRVEALRLKIQFWPGKSYIGERIRWRMCPEFTLPLNNAGQAEFLGFSLGPKGLDLPPGYQPPQINILSLGVDGSGCLTVEIDIQYQCDANGTCYNPLWHSNNLKELYIEVTVEFSGVEWGVPGSGSLEYSYEEGSGGGGSGGGGGGQPPEAPSPDQPQEQQQCVVQEVNAVAPLLGIAGMIGGVEGTPVDWIIFKNSAAPWPNGLDLRGYERVALGYSWLTVQPTTCQIQGERGADMEIQEYVFTLDYGLGPGFWHSETLPIIEEPVDQVQSTQYYFAWYVLLEWTEERDLNGDGRVDPWEVVRYRSTHVYYQGPFPIINRSDSEAGNPVFAMFVNAIKGALYQFFHFLKSLIPDEIERPLTYILGFLVEMLRIVVDLVRALYAVPAILDLFKLTVQLLPLFLLLLFAYDPLKGLDLLRKIISLISAIIQAIRAALPLP